MQIVNFFYTLMIIDSNSFTVYTNNTKNALNYLQTKMKIVLFFRARKTTYEDGAKKP